MVWKLTHRLVARPLAVVVTGRSTSLVDRHFDTDYPWIPKKDFGIRCGYDFREANATSVTEEIRKDLKGVYTNDIMIDGKLG